MAAPQVLGATLTGAQETPANASTATGTCSVSVNPTSLQVTFSGTFAGLAAQASAASLRGPAGVGAVGPVVLGQTSLTAGVSGTFQGSGVLTSEEVGGILGGQTYCEIADGTFPAGEIRGQLTVPPVVPAAGACGMACLGLLLGGVGIASLRLRARSQGGAGEVR